VLPPRLDVSYVLAQYSVLTSPSIGPAANVGTLTARHNPARMATVRMTLFMFALSLAI
jgi:hypothetical protein